MQNVISSRVVFHRLPSEMAGIEPTTVYSPNMKKKWDEWGEKWMRMND
jgi:hypothetical protein